MDLPNELWFEIMNSRALGVRARRRIARASRFTLAFFHEHRRFLRGECNHCGDGAPHSLDGRPMCAACSAPHARCTLYAPHIRGHTGGWVACALCLEPQVDGWTCARHAAGTELCVFLVESAGVVRSFVHHLFANLMLVKDVPSADAVFALIAELPGMFYTSIRRWLERVLARGGHAHMRHLITCHLRTQWALWCEEIPHPPATACRRCGEVCVPPLLCGWCEVADECAACVCGCPGCHAAMCSRHGPPIIRGRGNLMCADCTARNEG